MKMYCACKLQFPKGMSGRLVVFFLVLFAMACSGCTRDESDMKGGYYTAEAAGYDVEGWKEHLSIYVFNEKILTVTYDAKNAAGFSRSWDMKDMRDMKIAFGTYPSKYARAYAEDLLNKQTTFGMRALSGAARFRDSFVFLAEAAIAQSKAGDTRVVFVELPSTVRRARH